MTGLAFALMAAAALLLGARGRGQSRTPEHSNTTEHPDASVALIAPHRPPVHPDVATKAWQEPVIVIVE
jgi:hypothetical protein